MLEIIVASLYFINKIFLSLEKKTGWIVGFLAALTASIYFLNLKLYILVVLEVGYLFLMAFGFLNFGKKSGLDLYVNIIMVIVMLILLINIDETGVPEFIVSIAFIMAIHALAKHRWHLGWILFIFSHLLMAYITYSKNQYFFCIMQLASIGIAFFALSKKRKYLELQNSKSL